MSPREDDGLRREVPDEELVARVVAGDDRAFRELYLRHHVVITRRLRRLLGPRHDVEDVLQVTFVEAHRALRRFDAQRSFAAWLHGIALRQAANHLRKSRRWAWLRGRTAGRRRRTRPWAMTTRWPAWPTRRRCPRRRRCGASS
jgi:DNA-directed RNA polymerase specialized sigma24 family protein